MLIASDRDQIKTPTAIALGNFDGIHQGHRSVLRSLVSSVNRDSSTTVCLSVVSFTPHPREFFTGEKLQLLTPVPRKAELLADLGIEQLVLLPFDRHLASLTPQEFVERILVEQLQAKIVSVGEDFRFGYQRQGTGADLQTLAAKYGIEVKLNSLHTCIDGGEAVRVSSSLIRQALSAGEMETANQMLGRCYSLVGKVVTGKQLGRTIGFPTANLELDPAKFLPRFGVYAVDAWLTDNTTVKGIMNIGCRPTVAGESPTIEVHLLDWSGDLYGQDLRVELVDFIRPERKFDSVAALKQQITQDCQLVLRNYP